MIDSAQLRFGPEGDGRTHDEQRADALKQSPVYVKTKKEIEKVMKNLEYSQPHLTPSERIQAASKIVIARKGKPVKEKKG